MVKEEIRKKIEGHSLTVVMFGETFHVHARVKQYPSKRLAIQYSMSDGEPFGILTVNVPEITNLMDDEIIVRTTEENEALAKAALATGIFTDTHRRIQSGFIQLSVWRIN